MFRSILRIQSLKRKINLRRPINNYVRYSTNSNERNSRFNLKKQSNDFNNLIFKRPKDRLFRNNVDKSFQDDLTKSVSNCKNLDELFYLIEPHVTKLSSYQLTKVYRELREFSRLKSQEQKFSDSTRKSSILRSLLDHTSQLTRQLNTKYLIFLVEIFHLIDQDPKSPIVDKTLQELRIRLDEDQLKLNEIITLLRQMDHYLDTSVVIDNYFELNQHFIQIFKKKVMNKEFDLEDVQLINNCYRIFLNPINDLNYEMINYLNNQLLSSNYQLDFELAIQLLRKIKQAHFYFKENFTRSDRVVIDEIQNKKIRGLFEEIKLKNDQQRLFASSLNDLISKCNSTIFDQFLKKQQNENYFHEYLISVHAKTDYMNLEFANYYDKRLLVFLAPYLIERINSGKFPLKYLYNVIKHFAKFNIYDERLLKLMINLPFTDLDRLDIEYTHFYFMLSNYRLPFVDHQHLVKQLFDLSRELKNSYEFKKMSVRLLAVLILNDVNDEDLFNYLIKTIENLDEKTFIYYRPMNRFKPIMLAKSYLLIFSNVDSKMKKKINKLIDQLIPKIYPEKEGKKLGIEYFKINDKIQKEAFLSNGLHLNTIAVYNKFTNDLVSIEKYQIIILSNKIDQMQLDEDEEL